jgi:maleate isomerase
MEKKSEVYINLKMNYIPSIGVAAIVPSVNKVFEYEWNWAFKGEIPLFVSRAVYDFNRPDPLQHLLDDSIQAAVRLSQVDMPVCLFACTGASLYHGDKGNKDLTVELSEIVKSKIITASSGLVKGLKSIGITNISLITPYVQEDNQREISFLESNGFHVTSNAGMGIADAKYESSVTYSESYKFITKNVDKDSDGVLLSCTNWHTWPLVDSLEKKYKIPFVTSNLALSYSAVREIYDSLTSTTKRRIRDRRLGKLFGSFQNVLMR